MDKITKVQEISSFIRHFDSSYWNEIVLRLTIIGIRYIKNYCNSIFRWRMDDFSLILEELKQNKSLSSTNYKTNINYNNCNNNFNRNDNNFYKYNYNYSNTAFLKSDIKDKLNKKVNKNNKSKSLLNKSSLNKYHNNKKYYINNSNLNNDELNNNYNNSMIIFSDRESLFNNSNNNKNRKNFVKIKENTSKKIKEKKNINYQKYCKENNKVFEEKINQNTFLKNKKNNNRNKILSLNDKESFNNNLDINVIISDFPFNNKNNIKITQNDNNNNFYIENNINSVNDNNHQDLRDYLKKNNNIKEIKNNFNNSCILQNTYILETQIDKKNDNNNNDLIDEIKKQKENFDKNSYNFISELRKMSQSKDNKKRHSNILHQSKIYNIIPPLLIGDNNNKDKIRENYNNNHDISNNINNENNLINNNINIVPNKNINFNDKDIDLSFNYEVNNKEKILSKTISRKYDIKSKKEKFDLNCDYYTNNSIDNIQTSKPTINKYLRNPNYKNKKSRSSSIEDLDNKIINSNRTYIYSSDKENENNINANINQYCCHYYYESKS